LELNCIERNKKIQRALVKEGSIVKRAEKGIETGGAGKLGHRAERKAVG